MSDMPGMWHTPGGALRLHWTVRLRRWAARLCLEAAASGSCEGRHWEAQGAVLGCRVGGEAKRVVTG